MSANNMGSRRVAFVLALSCCLIACESDVEPLTPAQREAVAAYVSNAPPSPQHPLGIDFSGKATLLGYDIDQGAWGRGETIRVTWHWQATAPLSRGWKLFTQIEDPESKRVLDQNGNGTLRWLYGPEHWRAGQYIRDVQDLHLPADWEGASAALYVGMQREGVRLPTSDATASSDDRVLAAKLRTSGTTPSGRALDAVPRVGVVRTNRSPRLDGSLLDPVWRSAKDAGPFVQTFEGGPGPVEASAKLLWDERYLYVGMEVRDELLRAKHTEHDGHLWEQDCVELMVDPDGDGRSYFEIQVSPRGVVFDTRFDAPRTPKPFGYVEGSNRARVGVSTRGAIDDQRADAGYTVEIAIPWQAFSPEGVAFAPPELGEAWRANLFVLDMTRDRHQGAAWSPVGIADFHVPHRFGILIFEGSPQDMLGKNEPSTLAPGRLPASGRRAPALDPRLKDGIIRKRSIQRDRRAAPAASKHLLGLESPGGGH